MAKAGHLYGVQFLIVVTVLSFIGIKSKRPYKNRPVDETAKSRELILRLLLTFTLTWLVAAMTILFVSMVSGRAYLLSRLVSTGLITAFIGLLYYLARRGRARAVSYVLVGLYLLLVIGAYQMWGINNLQALLLAAFVVIMSGILISSRSALYVAAFVLALLFYVKSTFDKTIIVDNEITTANLVFLGVLLGLMALTSWLFNDQMEQSLRRAERSEAALMSQRDKLEEMVEERTKKLQDVQMEQMQQVYRFAELGILSTALLHDLANQLGTISVDIEGLPGGSNSKILSRVKRTISYIDSSVDKTRQQLEGRETIRRFDVNNALEEVVNLLDYTAKKANVAIEVTLDDKASPGIKGDEGRFKQMVTSLINNAIEAYGKHHEDRRVIISTSVDKKFIVINITDHGRGMPYNQQSEIFNPFYTTKKNSMGLGLFIAKEIAENSFGGKMKVASDETHGSEFAIKLPLRK